MYFQRADANGVEDFLVEAGRGSQGVAFRQPRSPEVVVAEPSYDCHIPGQTFAYELES